MKKILVVDDEEQNRSYLETLFQAQGFHVTIAPNGAQALEAARKNLPHIIISDILMPVMDGFMLCKEWKNDSRLKKIPFVFYTATYTEPKDEKLALDLGADLFVIKPQEPHILLDLIQKVMAKRKSEKKEKTPESETSAEVVLKEYNEALFRKLEKKLQQLETANQELRILEERYRLSFDHVSDVIYTIDTNLNILSVSPSVEKILGYKPQDFIGRPVLNQKNIFTPESFEQAIADVSQIFKGETISARIYEFIASDGTIKIGEVSGSPIIRDGQVAGLISVARDITDRKRAEDALRESENKYRLLADNVNDVIFVLDMNLNYTYVSPSVKILRGYEPEEVLKQSPIETLTPSSWELTMKTLSEVIELEKSERREELPQYRTLQLEMRRKDRTTVWTEVKFSFIRDKNRQPVGILGVTRDITERKRADETLRESEKKYRELYDFLPIPVYEMDFETKITSANRAIYEAFRGTEEDLKKGIKVWQLLSPEDIEKSRKNIERLLSGERVIGTEYTIKRLDGTFFPAIVISSVIYSNDKPVGLRGAIIDITERRQQEEELHWTLDRLRKAVGTTIQVMVSAVEIRDPYTAGHQLRVANLARAIATEMVLPQEKIEGIRMAGSIHDIGKLSIPAEILSKPTRLTELEFSLIKEHSRSGYEILKNVESSWPLAEMVYQHHERMDGSGYPRNLKGDDILIDARILAVADVIEAIASHRPYRPAFGIDIALEEIEKNKGILYDENVVNACLILFRNKKYKIA